MKFTFAAGLLATVGCAEEMFDLERAVQKNLKWIRPPKWGNMPDDIDDFFNQSPKNAPEFNFKVSEHP